MSARASVKDFRELVVWQKSRALALAAYALTETFPSRERFGVTAQIQRAALSIPANIAEGWGLGGSKQLRRAARIARGSLYELDTLLEIASALGFADSNGIDDLRARATEVARMLNGILRSRPQACSQLPAPSS